MSYRLKSRTATFPPSGFLFTDPKTGMKFTDGAFGDVVLAIIKHRRANPRIYPPDEMEALDVSSVGNELDAFTCSRLKNHGHFCESGEPVPISVDGLELMQMPNKCPKCASSNGYQILCKTCSGKRVTGYYCAECKTLCAK